MSLRSRASMPLLLCSFVAAGAAGCGDDGMGDGSSAQPGGTNGSAGLSSGAGQGGTLATGGGVSPGGATSGGANPSGGSNNVAGADPGGGQSSGGSGGQSPGGSGGQAPGGAGGSAGSAAGSGGSSGSGGGNATPSGVAVESHDLAVPAGKVFNVADNYFNDGLIPATPVANFGLHSQIISVVSDDGSLDVAWLDYTSGSGRPWALTAPGLIYLTHIDADLGSATTVSSGVSSYKLLGFAKDAAGASYLAYNKDHALKSTTQGNPNRIDGNELHVTKLSGGSPVWDQLVFGNQDNGTLDSLGDPGGASSGVLGYDPTNQKVVIYLGHSMRWDDGVRHQAGFLRLLNPSTGAVQQPNGNDVIHFGSGWFYSHNFNQRLLIDGGNYYVLAHGDAYARQLGFARWSVSGYTNDNDTDFDEAYWNIAGGVGDNKTDTQTGQFVKMPDGRFLIVHTSSQTRSARDVRLVFANGSNGTANTAGAVWLTTNQGTTHATMPKLELLGEHVLVTYALWDSTKGHALTWHAALLDDSLATVVAPKAIAGIEFVDSAPLFRFKAGPNAGNVGWVSGNSSHTLSVRVAAATQ